MAHPRPRVPRFYGARFATRLERPYFPPMVRATWVRVVASSACVLGLALGCNGSGSGGDDDDDDGNGSNGVEWVCFEGSLRCWCTEVGPGDFADSSDPEVLACRPFSCCLHSAGSQPGDGDCECEDLATDCQAEANSRPGTTAVPSCPPGPIDTSRCAASGVNCREDFLQQENLLGCCPGLTCQMNAAGVPVCL